MTLYPPDREDVKQLRDMWGVMRDQGKTRRYRLSACFGYLTAVTNLRTVPAKAAQTLWCHVPMRARGFIFATELGALTVEAPSLHDQEVPGITVQQLLRGLNEREENAAAIREAERRHG